LGTQGLRVEEGSETSYGAGGIRGKEVNKIGELIRGKRKRKQCIGAKKKSYKTGGQRNETLLFRARVENQAWNRAGCSRMKNRTAEMDDAARAGGGVNEKGEAQTRKKEPGCAEWDQGVKEVTVQKKIVHA